MKKFYQAMFGLSLFVVLFLSVATVGVGHESSRIFVELCNQPTGWDITFREDQTPVRDLTPEEVKSHLMHFASLYQPENKRVLESIMLIALVILIFSAIGWLRERYYRKLNSRVQS